METPLVDPAILIVVEPEPVITGNQRISQFVLDMAPKPEAE
jgi:hypothetical protein